MSSPSAVSNAVTQALKNANAVNGALPAGSCDPKSPTHVVCASPAAPAAQLADFRTYPSLTSLYRAYLTQAEAMSDRPVRTNHQDCNRYSPEGEISWNHLYQHPRRFSLAQSRAGRLDNEDQAAGRVFCVLHGSEETSVWTQNDGRVLGIVTGLPHQATFLWWKKVHHAIAVGGDSPMKDM